MECSKVFTTETSSPVGTNTGGFFMTKKTEGFVLSVYDFCLKLVFQAKREGYLSLEEYLYNQCLTESGKFIFNRKIDQFLYWIMYFPVYAGYYYTSKTGQNLLKSFSKRASRRTKLALNVAFLCIDGLINERATDSICIEVCSYLGVKLHQKLSKITIELQHWYENYDKELILTDDQKLRIEEVNGFFKLKEEECKRLLMQKHKKLREIQKKLPEFKFKKATTIKLIYHSGKSDFVLFKISHPFRRPAQTRLICGISVCNTLYEFWKHYLICDYRIERLMDITDDIPNEIAKNLEMKTEMQLSFRE